MPKRAIWDKILAICYKYKEYNLKKHFFLILHSQQSKLLMSARIKLI